MESQGRNKFFVLNLCLSEGEGDILTKEFCGVLFRGEDEYPPNPQII